MQPKCKWCRRHAARMAAEQGGIGIRFNENIILPERSGRKWLLTTGTDALKFTLGDESYG